MKADEIGGVLILVSSVLLGFYMCSNYERPPMPEECSKEWISYKANRCHWSNAGCMANVQFEINKTCLNK